MSGVTVSVYILQLIFPGLQDFLAIIATNTYGAHSYVWNIFTAGFFNDNIAMVPSLKLQRHSFLARRSASRPLASFPKAAQPRRLDTPPCTACRPTLTCSPSRPRQTLAVALSLIVMGRYLVASWGSHEFLRYTIFVNSAVGFGIFVAQIFYYMTSFKYRYLEVPVSGGMGILAALVVTIKQRLGDVSAAAIALSCV
jgi:hypothetical protein